MSDAPKNPIIIVGGGLAGLSAAHQAYLRGSNVILLDKQGFLSGNSGKATSGINGALTRTQVNLNIKDSVEQFYQDTMASAKDRANPDLIKVLTYNSADAVHWLQEIFGLDLTVVSRLGGHAEPRTHRGKDAKFPGMAITYALMEKLETLAEEQPHRVSILKKTEVVDVVKKGNVVTGVKFKDHNTNKTGQLAGPVIMATGGYAADFTNNSLLKKYRPDIIDLPSTNGTHATGDGQKIIMKNGGVGIDLEKVQVHPTGLLDPKDQKSGKTPKFLFLGAEALRGEGGIMLDATGKRFCDELGTRDYVSGEMTKVDGPIRLILNSQAGKNLAFHVKHYTQRGLMRTLTGAQLIKEMGVDQSVIEEQFRLYNLYASGKEKCPFGKKYFPAVPLKLDDTFHVAYITRVLHFTMGGVKINDKSQVLNEQSQPIENLYAAGELAGGVHGHNRLGGSSLLACVVYGRVSADTATSELLGKLSVGASSAANRLNQIKLHIDPDVPGKVTVEWDSQGDKSETAKPSTSPSTSSPKKTVKKQPAKPIKKPVQFKIPAKQFTVQEVAKHNKKTDCWVIVKDVVMDVTKFLPDHPGGAQSIINFAGKDATEVFEMLHEDRVIPKYAPECVLGRIKGKTPKLEFK